jgi:CRISPR-associated endonuclease/helicase Cas3
MTLETKAGHAFRAVWGVTPFDYQLRVADYLLAGRNVVLAAPTGAGKTVAALHPFVQARREGLAWADRLLYALPYRTLTSALHDTHKGRLDAAGLKVSLQTGLYRGDPTFRSDICFATIDQVLSAYVGQPVSLGETQANIAGGALVGAYLVLDEFHLLEADRALATALDLAKRLRGFVRLLFMTATASAPMLDYLAGVLQAEVVTPAAHSIPAQSTRRRSYAWIDEPLSADAVWGRRRDRTIVVVNTVDRAQALYEQLRELQAKMGGAACEGRPGDTTPALLLLHSRFLPEDRRRIEQEALSLFARGSDRKGILVATQVVEVGLDISAQTLLTELAPASSLVQRAGRCARFADEAGEVVVFEAGDPSAPSGRYRPYATGDCLATRKGLEDRLAAGPVVADYAWERSLVDEALGETDRAAVSYLAAHGSAWGEAIELALAQDPKAAYRRFVRSVDATAVIIHSDPAQLDLRQGLDTLSVSDPVLRGFLGKLELAGADAGLVSHPEWNDDPHQENASPVKSWKPVTSWGDLRGQFLLAVSPKVASYDPAVGLRLGTPGTWEVGRAPAAARGGADKKRFGGVAESFRQHALDVARRSRELAQGEAVAAGVDLAAALGCPRASLMDLIDLVGALHDLGKLDCAWQDGIWQSQMTFAAGGLSPKEAAERAAQGPERTRPVAQGAERFLAHSDRPAPPISDPGVRAIRLPPHSVAGACAGFPILRAFVGRAFPPAAGDKILAAALAAIARHHYPWSGEFTSFRAAPGAAAEVAEIVGGLGLTGVLPAAVSSPNGRGLMADALKGAHPSNPQVWCLYWFLARFLRLADQTSQAELVRSAGRG